MTYLRATHYCVSRKFCYGGAMSGLRERKKEATRVALSWAAIRLTVERGLDNVRVEDIAEAVGVSPRTFNNYFSSKAEAIAFRHLQRSFGWPRRCGPRRRVSRCGRSSPKRCYGSWSRGPRCGRCRRRSRPTGRRGSG